MGLMRSLECSTPTMVGGAALRREDMIFPVQVCRYPNNVDDSRTSRWHRNDDVDNVSRWHRNADDVDNEPEPCRHRDDVDDMSRRHSPEKVADMGPRHRHGVDEELASELSYSDMHLLGQGNAQSNLVVIL